MLIKVAIVISRTIRNIPPGKFRNLALKKDGEDQMDGSCEKLISIKQSQGGQEYPTYNKNEEN